MAKQGLHYTISAKDQSSRVLRTALGSITSFGRAASHAISAPFRAVTSLKGLGLQANIALLQRTAATLDRFVERGTRVALVGKAFESLTGRSGPALDRLARQLQAASGGVLKLSRVKEIANRALSAGLSVDDIRTTFDFISKKALVTGKDVEQSLDTVITGLSRGSTLFLDDFGILVDGVDKVRRDFDAINGSGAFDKLSDSARKMETVKAATAEMRQQVALIGVTGKELAFRWMAIKTSIGDAVDKIASSVVNSERMKKVIGDVATISESLARALGGGDQGEAIGKLFAGAKDIMIAFFKDVGSLLAGPLLEGGKKFLGFLWTGFKAIGGYLADLLVDAAEKFVAKLKLAANDLPVIGGFLGEEGIRRQQAILNKKGPVLDLSKAIGDLIEGGRQPPFSRTEAAISKLSGEVHDLGKDQVEKEIEKIKSRKDRARQIAKERELRESERRLTLLDEKPAYMTNIFHQEAVKRLQEQMAADPELTKKAAKDERLRLVAEYEKEARDEYKKRLVGRIAELKQEGVGRVQKAKAPADALILGPHNPLLAEMAPVIPEPAAQAGPRAGAPGRKESATAIASRFWRRVIAQNLPYRMNTAKAMGEVFRERARGTGLAAEVVAENAPQIIMGGAAGAARRVGQAAKAAELMVPHAPDLMLQGLKNIWGAFTGDRQPPGPQSRSGINRAADEMNDGSRSLVASASHYREAARRSEQAARELAAVVALV